MDTTQFATIVGYVLGLLLIFVITKIFFTPIKVILRLLLNSVLGVLIMLLINSLSSYTGIFIGINPITALITGILGVPGICLILILQILF